MLVVENVSKKFEHKDILKNVSFKVDCGAITTIIAPNGTGKTTLLSVLSGLLIPDSGVIRYNSPKGAKDVTIVLAGEKNLYMKNTVEENVYYFSIIRGMSCKEIKRRIDLYIEFFPLYEQIKNKVVEKLSYGQKRLVAIFSAIISDSKYILLDEVTEGLDADHIGQISKLLKCISKEKIIILASHDYNFVSNISDSILFLKDGGFIQQEISMNLNKLKQMYSHIYNVEVS